MDLQKLNKLINKLSLERKIFHSEADFQHSFAFLLHKENSTLEIRLEKRYDIKNKSFYVDIAVFDNKSEIGIELKYKTKLFNIRIGNEQYKLKEAASNDLGRYHFREDIFRLESLIENNLIKKGFVVF